MTAVGAMATRAGRGSFARLWLARLVSSAGSEVTAVALPLVAVLTLGSSPFDVALLTAAGYLPSLLFGLAAGSLADRIDRRRLLIAADIARAATLLAVPAAAVAGWLSAPTLVIVAFLVGTGTVVFDVAVQALTPALLGEDELVRGNARLQLAEQSVGLIGPAAGGALVAVVGAPLAVLADAASYLASAGFVATIASPPREPAGVGSAAPGASAAAGGGALEGLRFVATHPLLRVTAASSFLINLGARGIEALLIVALVRIGGLGPGGVGLVLSGGAVGFVIGALLADRVTERLGLGPSLAAGLGVVVVTFFAMALAPAGAFGPVIAVAFAVYGVAAVVSTVAGLSVRQGVTPAPLLGRVSAAVRTAVYAAFPIGAVAAGLIASAVDIRSALLVCAAVSSTGFVVVLLSPVRRVRSVAALRMAAP
jgi:MFS family permease